MTKQLETIRVDELMGLTYNQALYKLLKRIVDQGDFSNEGKICRYRSGNGLKCAVGWLIPDNQYSDIIEGKGWLDSSVKSRIPDFHIASVMLLDVISDAQLAHDMFASYEPCTYCSLEFEEYKVKRKSIAFEDFVEFVNSIPLDGSIIDRIDIHAASEPFQAKLRELARQYDKV